MNWTQGSKSLLLSIQILLKKNVFVGSSWKHFIQSVQETPETDKSSINFNLSFNIIHF